MDEAHRFRDFWGSDAAGTYTCRCTIYGYNRQRSDATVISSLIGERDFNHPTSAWSTYVLQNPCYT
jgi:hypothetical protein